MFCFVLFCAAEYIANHCVCRCIHSFSDIPLITVIWSHIYSICLYCWLCTLSTAHKCILKYSIFSELMRAPIPFLVPPPRCKGIAICYHCLPIIDYFPHTRAAGCGEWIREAEPDNQHRPPQWCELGQVIVLFIVIIVVAFLFRALKFLGWQALFLHTCTYIRFWNCAIT